MTEFGIFLQENLGEHNPEEIEELILDNLFSSITQFSKEQKLTLSQYNNLFHLSLNNLGISSLENFPLIPNLLILEIKQNKLTGNDFDIIPKLYPNIYKLKISYNFIKTIKPFKHFQKSNIKKIEVSGNEFIIKVENYRNELFNLLPELMIIDGISKDGDTINTTIYSEYSIDDNISYENEEIEDDERDESYNIYEDEEDD
jgi:acidic leucine-rich nuclear phosphoprotein 32 family protein A/C/D